MKTNCPLQQILQLRQPLGIFESLLILKLARLTQTRRIAFFDGTKKALRYYVLTNGSPGAKGSHSYNLPSCDQNFKQGARTGA